MGEEVEPETARRAVELRHAYRRKLQTCVEVFEQALERLDFDDARQRVGLEVELHLVDVDGQPLFANQGVLEEIADPAFQTELGAYNLELNVPPRSLAGAGAQELEQDLRRSLNAAEQRAHQRGGHLVTIGLLPTLTPEHAARPDWMSPSARYRALQDAVLSARGEEVLLEIEGEEQLRYSSASIAPESACTSAQLHLQVTPDEFAATWNAAQLLAPAQLALAANSPFFFGRRLWQETRVEVFTQAVDTRPEELRNQGVRPRVWFGQDWIDSVADLFRENVRYFPPLLPEVGDEDPAAVLAAGRAPELAELRLHNGTVYRWNRPVYEVGPDGRPHLRVENRVLPAGPTVVDLVANAVFYYGLLESLRTAQPSPWTALPFAAAERNFVTAARYGLAAEVEWPGCGRVPLRGLILDRLLPAAAEGLARWGVSGQVATHYLEIIEARARSGRTAAAWQVAATAALEDQGRTRDDALAAMLQLYRRGMHSNTPVHTWPVP